MCSEAAVWAIAERLSASEKKAKPKVLNRCFVTIRRFLFNRAREQRWMPDYYNIVIIPQRLFCGDQTESRLDVRFGASVARESESNGCAPSDFASNFGRAAVKIDNRLYQRETETAAACTARWIGPIKAVEDARKMFGRNS